MPRSNGILLRVALAVPMAYGAWSLAAWRLTPVLRLRMSMHVALYDFLPAMALLSGCAIVIAGWNSRWAWGIVAAVGVWLVWFEGLSLIPLGVGSRYLLRHLPPAAAIGVYAFMLAMAFILAGQAGVKKVLAGERQHLWLHRRIRVAQPRQPVSAFGNTASQSADRFPVLLTTRTSGCMTA